MQEHWDVIVVGARCAGATLATKLSKQGLRVLVLEASGRGTNMPMSTHLIQPPGMDALDRLGVGARVRAVTPAAARMRYALDDSAVVVSYAAGRAAYCVRRSTLDPWLQDCAQEAGAELRFRHRVVSLLKQDERVVGVVARTPDGNVELRADLVVGADGARSTIAELTGAPEYLRAEWTRAGYFGYWPAPAQWTADWDAMLEHQGTDLRYVFRCDGDQVLMVCITDRNDATTWGAAHRERLEAKLRESPQTSALLGHGPHVGPLTGLLKASFFYRQPVGPGYALVGDAGHFKDFITGMGMTDAFLDAERLADAIVDGRPAAMQHYWRERDVATLPLHFDALRQGAVGFNEPFIRWIIGRMAHRPEQAARVTAMFDRKIDPADLVPLHTAVTALIAGLVRGRFELLPGFLATGRANARDARELKQRKALLAEARAELARSGPAPTRTPSATPALALNLQP
ncbi:MAG: NAD(P)/FAD-dependent oxidoreductase [Polyangiales bacterium]